MKFFTKTASTALSSSFMLLTALASVGYAQTSYEKKPCSTFGSNASGCQNCFDGGTKAVGDVFRPNESFEASDKSRIYFADENQLVYSVKILNSNTSWFTSYNLLNYPDSLTWYSSEGVNPDIGKGRSYLFLEPHTKIRILEASKGKGIKLEKVTSSSIDDVPDMRLKFTHKYRNFLGKGSNGMGSVGELKETGSCVFYYAGN